MWTCAKEIGKMPGLQPSSKTACILLLRLPFGNQKRRKDRPDERRTKKGKVISRKKSKRRKDYRE